MGFAVCCQRSCLESLFSLFVASKKDMPDFYQGVCQPPSTLLEGGERGMLGFSTLITPFAHTRGGDSHRAV